MAINNDNNFWQRQYELVLQALMDENNRFWSRFNISLAVNAGILVAFTALITNLDKIKSSGFIQISLLGIIILGITTSGVWIAIIRAGIGARKRLVQMGKDLERNRTLPIEIFGDQYNHLLTGSITRTSYWYPIIYIIFWVCLAFILCRFNIF